MYTEFLYLKPSSFGELYKMMNEHPNHVFLAGGTDLLISIRAKTICPEAVIDIKEIPELRGIKEEEKNIFIGATTTISELEENKIISKHFSIFQQAIDVFACYEIRNRATIGGNISRASPAADFSQILLLLDAKVKILSSQNESRSIPLNDFFHSPGKTDLQKGEILEGFQITKNPNFRAVYLRRGRGKGMDLACVNVGIGMEKAEPIQNIRVVLGAVSPRPIRGRHIEKYLQGKTLSSEHIKQAILEATRDINPISDVRGSDRYRIEVVKDLIRRGLKRWMRNYAGNTGETQ